MTVDIATGGATLAGPAVGRCGGRAGRPARAGSVVNRCGGGWSAVADAPSTPLDPTQPRSSRALLAEAERDLTPAMPFRDICAHARRPNGRAARRVDRGRTIGQPASHGLRGSWSSHPTTVRALDRLRRQGACSTNQNNRWNPSHSIGGSNRTMSFATDAHHRDRLIGRESQPSKVARKRAGSWPLVGLVVPSSLPNHPRRILKVDYSPGNKPPI